MTPVEYEKYCEGLFKLEGWRTSSTNTSGDQGADIVADSGENRVVVQCKYYSKPVGNSAVQEVAAARAFYDANLALVVSRYGFTKAAKALAERALVQLVIDANLQRWARDNRQRESGIPMKAADMITVLNGSGYRVARKGVGMYVVSTPTGLKHVSGDAALMIVAEELLKRDRKWDQ